MTRTINSLIVILLITSVSFSQIKKEKGLKLKGKAASLREQNVQRANFNSEYRIAFRDSIIIETNAVRELVYIIMSLTDFAKTDYGIVNKQSEYYKHVMNNFAKYSNDKLVIQFHNLISNDMENRMLPEINASAYEFNEKGKILKRSEYTNIRGKENFFEPLINELERFANETKFLSFFHAETTQFFYKEVQDFYKDEAEVERMVNWLKMQFPSSAPFESIKIIASPLVRGWEHEDVVSDKGFSQIILHSGYLPALKNSPYSINTQVFLRTDMLFSELNHGSLNPLAEKYQNEINKSFKNKLNIFIKNDGSHSEYLSPLLAFEEYMNWGLVALYANDVLPEDEREIAEQSVIKLMEMRGEFPEFKPFLNFLLTTYRNKTKDETVEELFPSLIDWFKKYQKI